MRPLDRYRTARSRRSLAAAAALCLLAAAAVAPPAEAANHNVTVQGLSFTPANLTIQAGDSVTWTNAGGVHNVRADNLSFRCANGCDATGGNGDPSGAAWSVTLTFATPGQIPYHCQLHGSAGGIGMAGTIVVQGNDQPGALRFSSSGYSVGEGAGQTTITVRRVGGDDGAVAVSYATANGSATAGFDYTARSGTLNWPDNDDNPRTFTVPILDDSLDELNETVNLTLSNPTGGATLGSPSNATLTIADDDPAGGGGSPGSLSLAAATANVGEPDGPATLTVRRTGGSDGAVSVSYDTADGTAVAGSDYTPVSGSVDFAAGDAADKTFDVPILDDSEAEGDETFGVALSAPTGGAALGTPAAATVTVLDDDVVEPGPCIEDAQTACLLDGRFRVRVEFRAPGGPLTMASRIPLTDRAVLFWFFNPNNVEMLLKMQNACVDPFNHFWVFLAATTNVEYTVTVTDTEALRARTYRNPPRTAALPVQDTEAFATCP